MAPSTSKSPARASGGGGKQSTLLGFFGKAAATTPAKPSPKSTASGSAATPSRTPARPASARPTPNGSSSSVSSSSSTSTSTLSSLGSVDQRAATAAAAATTPSASKKRAAAGGPASSTARTAAVAATKPLSSRLTPPASSDPDGMDIDEDDEDLMPVRRRSAAKRTISYAESDDEAGGGGGETDSEADEDGGSFSPSASKKRRSSGGRTLKRSRTARDDDNFIVSDNDVEEEEEEDDDDERALAATDDDSEDEAPLSKKAPSRAKAKAAHADTSPRPSSLGGFRMGSGPSSRPSPSSSSGRLDQPGRPALGSRPTPPGGSSLSHLTKAERRVIEEKRKRAENEQAYSFLVDLRDKDGKRPGEPDYDPRTVHIPASAWKDFTPFEVQFWKIKQNHFDTVLFFQKGKFYELYEDDALIGHREFDLKLTDRVKMKMVGVPESSFDMFAAKFLALGYKVGRVDQTETAVAKGMRVGEKSRGGGGEIVNRELRHVLTSGTIVDASALPDDLNSYCVSIKEVERAASAGADGGPRFGVCTLDASTAEFNLSEFDDDASRTRLETLLRSLRLKEVLHEKGGLSPATARVLRNTVPAGCQTTMLKPGSEFLDAEATRDRLDGLFGGGSGGAGGECGNDDDEGGDGGATAAAAGLPQGIASMLDRDAAMSALGAMLSYLATLNLERDLCSSRNFNIFDPLRQDRCMVLDAQSLTHLNVLQNDQGTDVGTLHRLLNRCATPFGKRLFKIWMVAPLADIDAIRARQDAVDDFLGCPAFEEAFDAFARQLPDIERIIPRIYAGKCRPKDFTRVLTAFGHFRESVERLRALAESFAGEGGGRVAALLASIPDVTALAGELRSRFQLADDGSFTPRRGVFAPYDEAEAALLAIEAQLEDELQACRRLLKLNAARCGWKHLGTKDIYQIEVPATTKVPASWVKLSGTKDRHRFYSPEVRDLVQELKEARETRLAALKQFHAALFAEFVAESARYVEAVKAVAEVDCLLSLAKASYAIGEPTCRPELVEHDTALVEFDELRHPCIAEGVDFIPNDIRLGGDSDEVVILTGGNMAGKSTTARTTATAVIIAQLGCRVPALRARISPVDRIASRMGANDQIFRNNSTFMVEMLEASRIVRECTPRSLVVMDELGRGTSTFDGQAIAFAVLHHLVSRTRCLSFFLTHYTSLAYDFQGYPRVSNKHLQVLVDDDRREVVFTYRLVDGVAESSYGTQVAALAGVPHEICDRAAAVSKQFLESTKEHLARREQSRIPLATLSDFTHLVRLADDPAAANAGVNVGAGGSTSASDGSGAARMAAVAASQLAVIRAQVKSLASAAASSAPPGQHGERGKAAALAARPDVACT
ncbi:related to MSH6 - DNA mismatch repair protein [Pseudozyma flocculosa]|uniref:DNA mismatch repair protein n=1 Tax=Pseudozyma flocculosa TaxID=84751 RepID=A0A5C3F8I0_9BASI|nr:related to MSH6 - DNA mismatch repair protein [Pseudozyma flocculosa]